MPSSTLFTAAQYAALASAQVGKPYVLGANGPDRFDCSGLVIWLNNQSGAFPMGDDTAAGLFNRTKAVVGSPAVGDLVFLANNPARSNRIGHVAVLTRKLSNGDWEIIEARGRAYGVVRTTLSYWRTRKYFTGVRRLPGFRLATSTPTPTTPSNATSFWATTFNCLDPRFGGRGNDDAAVLRKAAASVYLLTEAPAVVRTNIRKGLAGGLTRWLVWTRTDTLPQAILFDRTKWRHGDCTRLTFGPTSYHGAVIAVLTRRDTGRRVQFAALHLPPRVVSSEADRRAAFLKLVGALDRSLPTVIGGDFNTEAAAQWLVAAGFGVAQTGDTTDKGKRYDYVAALGGAVTRAEVYNPGAASDHRAVRAKASFPASSTTT